METITLEEKEALAAVIPDSLSLETESEKLPDHADTE